MTDIESAAFEIFKMNLTMFIVLLTALGLILGALYLFNLKPYTEGLKDVKDELKDIKKEARSNLLRSASNLDKTEGLLQGYEVRFEAIENRIESVQKANLKMLDEKFDKLTINLYEVRGDLDEQKGWYGLAISTLAKELKLRAKNDLPLHEDYHLDIFEDRLNKATESLDTAHYSPDMHESLMECLKLIKNEDNRKQKIVKKSKDLLEALEKNKKKKD